MYQGGSSQLPLAKSAIVVLGMHRSGTSALSRAISLFGFTQPSDATGNWESKTIVRLNARILRELNARWHYPGPFLAPGTTFAETRKLLTKNLIDQHCDNAVAELDRAYGAAERIVLKDPRICILWGLWDEALRASGFAPQQVLIFRNPIEVAKSLERRDGFELEKGLRLWLQYHLEALEAYDAGKLADLVSYEDMLAKPVETMQSLLRVLGTEELLSDPALENVQAFLTSSRRHHVISVDDLIRSSLVSGLIKDVYGSLCEWQNLAREEKSTRISRWHAEFDDFCLSCGIAIPINGSRVQVDGRVSMNDQKSPGHPADRAWKFQVGRITFYNFKREGLHPPHVESEPMDVKVVRDAFISRRSVTSDGTPGGSRYISSAIYDAQGAILPEFLKPLIYGQTREVFQNPPMMDPARIAGAESLTGRYVYLGTFYKHFGRFLLGTMARAWHLIGLDPHVRMIAHSDRVRDTSEFSEFVRTTLNYLGVASDRVLLATRDLRVEELIVPSPQFWMRRKGSPGFCLAFDHIRNEIMRANNLADGSPKKIYLTRRHHDQAAHASRRLRYRKLVVNEEQAEALFASRGFHIVAPERLPFEQQIVMIGNASHVAGLAGSALHMILFNDGPDTKLIQLAHRQVTVQRIIDDIRGVDAHHIHCVRSRDENQRPTLDTAVIEKALDEIC